MRRTSTRLLGLLLAALVLLPACTSLPAREEGAGPTTGDGPTSPSTGDGPTPPAEGGLITLRLATVNPG
jgi:hypothetical protein